MYVSVSRLHVPEERAGSLVSAFRRRSGLVDDWEGFVDLQVWQSEDAIQLERLEHMHTYEVADRYFADYPDDLERYGDVARAWEVHDTQYLLAWALGDVAGYVELERQVTWLARILEAREFPLDHLAGNLLIAADVIAARVAGAEPVAERLRAAAALVRSTPSFL
jgi:hypothetical protein